jgi:hypothetical protein
MYAPKYSTRQDSYRSQPIVHKLLNGLVRIASSDVVSPDDHPDLVVAVLDYIANNSRREDLGPRAKRCIPIRCIYEADFAFSNRLMSR